MYEKLERIITKFSNNVFKITLVTWIILFVLLIISVTVTQKWSTLLNYPEESYQNLEDEAIRMTDTHNLETDNLCTYNYNNKTKSLSFDLADVNNNILITVNISNYATDDQQVSITRNTNKTGKIFTELLSIVLFPLMFALIIILIILILLLFLLIVVFVLHKIREKFLSKKEQKRHD